MLNPQLVTIAVLLLGSPAAPPPQEPTKPAQAAPAVAVPDTPAGRGLKEFVDSFNAGGDKRRAWIEQRTTMQKENGAEILRQDAEILGTHGPMTLVRVPESSPTKIVAILRHAKTGAHAHLTIEVEGTAPNKISNMQLRGATPEEIKGF